MIVHYIGLCMAGRSERNWKPKARFHVGDVSIVNNTVYLTDGDGSGEPDTTETPTLWLCTTGKKMRTGRTVKIEG